MNRKEKTIVVTIAANLLLVALKYGLGAISGSLALRASALHSAGDVFVSLFVLAGLVASRWEARRHNQLGVIEKIVALVVSGLIFYIAYDIFTETLTGRPLDELMYAWPVTIASLLTIAITYFTARYKEYVGRATNSPSLIAASYHARMDVYASILVVVSLAASALGLGTVDRLAAVVVIVLAVLAGWEIASSAVRGLLASGRAPLELEEENPVHARQHLLRFVHYAAGLIALFTLLSGLYVVRLGERGVVRRFGQVVATVEPGMHYRVPLVDRVDVVAIDEVRELQTPSSLMLTGDTNLIEVRLGVHYRTTDPVAYLFNVDDPDLLLRQEAEAAIRQAVAERPVEELLTKGRAAILQQTQAQLQRMLDEHNAGVTVTNVQLLAAVPPSQVAESFRDVASAREDKNTYINAAYAYLNEIVPLARGEADKAIRTAAAGKQRKIDLSTGEALRFIAKLDAQRDAPAITRMRLYLESLERVLPAARKFILDPSVQTNTTDLWLSEASQASPRQEGKP